MPIYSIRAEDDIYTTSPAVWCMARGSGGKLYCAYTYEGVAGPPDKLGVSVSLDEGITWAILFELIDPIDKFSYPSLTIDNIDKLHLTYVRFIGGVTPEVKYRSYSAAGVLSAELDLSPGPGNQYNPVIVIDGTDTAHVLFGWTVAMAPDEMRHITIVGNAIVLNETVPGLPAAGVSDIAAAIDRNNNVYVVCIERAAWDVKYICRTAVGWGGVEDVSVPDLTRKCFPGIVIDRNNNVYVTWCNNPPAGGVYYRDKTGGVWGATQTLSATRSLPIIVVNNNDVLTAIFRNLAAPLRIYYRQAPIGGVWSAPLRLTSYTDSESHGSFLWAMWPQIGGIRTNVPVTGYALVFRLVPAPGAEELKYFASPGLSWVVPTSIMINKAYALAREEL